jgi:hypothetical protein
VYYLKDGLIVREVVNPQRKQIKPVKEGETIVTELEQLARLYPYDPVESLRVKSLVNFMTQDFTFSQIERLEATFTHFIAGKIDTKSAMKMLMLAFDKGGVGLEEKEARRMVSMADKLLDQAGDIKRFRKQYDQAHVFFNQHQLAERLRDHLLGAYHMKLTKKQDENLVEIIADRVVGVSGEKEFSDRLLEGSSKNGLGLSFNEAEDLTRYFEKIIAQGVDVSYKA